MKRLALFCLLAAPMASAQDWMATSFDHTEVSPGIYMLTGAGDKTSGGNVSLLVGEEYVVLIDDSFTPLGPALLEKIEELAGRPANSLLKPALSTRKAVPRCSCSCSMTCRVM